MVGPGDRHDWGPAVSRVLYRPLREWAIIDLGGPSRARSNGLPACLTGPAFSKHPPSPAAFAAELRGTCYARLFGLSPGGVYRTSGVATGVVGSYPAVSPLPLQAFGGRRSSETSLPASKFGGLFSVALSLTERDLIDFAFVRRRRGMPWHAPTWMSRIDRVALRRFPLGTTLSCGARTFLPPSPRRSFTGLAAGSGGGNCGGRSPRRPRILKERGEHRGEPRPRKRPRRS